MNARALVAVPILLLLASCSPTDPTSGDGCLTSYRPIESALSTNRSRWSRQGPAAYTFRFERGCFCPEEIRGPFLVRVEDGVVRSATTLSGTPATSHALPLILSVPGVFVLIEDAIDRRACSIRVVYDPALGYPTEVDVDYDQRLADEELYLRLAALAPL